MLSLVNIKEDLQIKIQVCVTNLGNYKYVYGYINSLSDIADLEQEVNPLGMNDTEVQLIDSDIIYQIESNPIPKIARRA